MLSRISRRSAQVTVAAAAGTTRAFGYQPRLREYQFLYDVFKLDEHYKALGREDITKDLVDTLLEENAKVCTNVLAPLYMSGDTEGCHLGTDGNVTTPKGYKAAWDQMVEGGWVGFGAPEKYGGQGMPASLSGLQKEMVATANWAFGMYPGLAQGAITTLDTHGTEEQKEKFLRPMATGQWGGTMCLTEPHCGTDLGFCTTKAEPNGDGTYKINGTKIFISSGDHDLTENIVHIVLAKLPNCPPGTKGLSLFIVPRNVIKADGTLEKKKNVVCAGLEKKMGIKANATAVLAFENSTGYLIGKEHDGMRMMFTFMNQARMGTAMQGVAHSELAFQNALAYTRERGSMRAMSGAKVPEKTQDPIIYHAPVKSAVCFAKCISEAGRAFVLELAMLYDRVENAKDEKERKLWDDKMGILTPMAKGLLTELGQEAAMQAQQCFGGHGFIKDNGMEQIVRDARISTLYEGTTGIQALDFIGRKVMLSKKDHLGGFQKQMIAVCKQHLWESGVLGQCSRALMKRIMTTVVDTQRLKLRALKDRDTVSSASVDFLYLNGYQAIGYYWLRLASAAKKKIDAGEDTDGFYKQKLDMCEYYFTVVFPRVTLHRQLMFNPSNIALKINNDILDQ